MKRKRSFKNLVSAVLVSVLVVNAVPVSAAEFGDGTSDPVVSESAADVFTAPDFVPEAESVDVVEGADISEDAEQNGPEVFGEESVIVVEEEENESEDMAASDEISEDNEEVVVIPEGMEGDESLPEEAINEAEKLLGTENESDIIAGEEEFDTEVEQAVETLSDANCVESGEDENGFLYTAYDDGTAEITGYNGTTAGGLLIPSKIGEYTVTSIGNCAFEGRNDLAGDLMLPSELTTIGEYAFKGCGGLTGKLKLPSSLTTIEPCAFSECNGLTGDLVLPSGLITIGDSAFSGCSGLTGDLVLPSGLTEISAGAFLGCVNLTGNLVLPSGLITIGNAAFEGCSGLTGELILPSGLATIGSSAFVGCSGLTGDLDLPSGLMMIGNGAFRGCSGLTGDLVLPSGLTMIGNGTFQSCSGLTGLIFSSGITTIEAYAFSECSGLMGTLDLPSGLMTIENGAFAGCSGLIGLTFPSGLTTIGDSVFWGCSGLTGELVLPSELMTIGYGAFCGCNRLTGELVLPTSLKTIGDSAFWGCSGFTGDLEIPAGVQKIGSAAFNGCSGLTGRLILSKNVGEIAENAFFIGIYFVEGHVGESLRIGESKLQKIGLIDSNLQLSKSLLAWKSSDENIAVVDENGKVTAKKAGEAEIIATAFNGMTAKRRIHVDASSVASIKLNKTSTKIRKGKTFTLKATVSPVSAVNKKVTWKSSNSKIAAVSSSGKVTAKGYGKATITATAADGSKKTAKCTVTVGYGITYKLSGGTNNSKNPSVYYNETITLKNPSLKGFVFKGWYIDSKFKTKLTKITPKFKINLTLYAKWAKASVGKTAITSLKNSSGMKAVLKYKKVSGASGYEILYSTDKNFKKGNKKVSSAKTSVTLSKLTKGKTYYVKVRAFCKDFAGNKVYGKYSAVKKVKIVK